MTYACTKKLMMWRLHSGNITEEYSFIIFYPWLISYICSLWFHNFLFLYNKTVKMEELSSNKISQFWLTNESKVQLLWSSEFCGHSNLSYFSIPSETVKHACFDSKQVPETALGTISPNKPPQAPLTHPAATLSTIFFSTGPAFQAHPILRNLPVICFFHLSTFHLKSHRAICPWQLHL